MSFIADAIDNIGTALNLPEMGWSENFSGGKPTVNTGRVPFLGGATGTLSNGQTYTDPNYAGFQKAIAAKTASNIPGSNVFSGINANDPNAMGTGTSTATANVASPLLAQYDQGINTLQSAIDRAGSQLGIAQGNINSQFNTNQNELNTAKANAQQSYDNSGVQNQQSLRTNKNTIADQASSGLRGLMRTLGAYGAAGSSDALFNAPQAVAQQATAQRSGAGQTFASNQQNLDTNWNNFLNSDQTSRQKLNDWKTQQLNSAQAQTDTTKQSLLQKLADLQGQRAAYAGGSYASAAQPLLDQANSLSSQIDQLGAINPTYNGTTPTYTAPTLDSYLANADTKTSLGQGAASQDVSPYLSALLGLGKNKNGTGASF